MTTFNKQLKLYGIAGTNGAGKDTLAELLVNNYQFFFVSVSQILRDIALKQTMSTNRKTTAQISTELREKHGYDYLVSLAIETFQNQKSNYNGLVISSIRNEAEALAIQEVGGKMIWLDAKPEIRYQRVSSNVRHHSQRINDQVSYQDFLAAEQAEMYRLPGQSKATLAMSEVKKICDYFVMNDSTPAELELQVKALIDNY